MTLDEKEDGSTDEVGVSVRSRLFSRIRNSVFPPDDRVV